MYEVEEWECEMLLWLVCVIEFCDVGISVYLECMVCVVGLIVEQFGLFEEEVCLIEMVVLLYDMGKIVIFDVVLFKQGKFNEEELVIMCWYSWIGYELLSGSQNCFIQVGVLIVLCYYECYDGSGYFDGLVGDVILLEVCIVVVVDVFDVLILFCLYKEVWIMEVILVYFYVQCGWLFDF